MILFRRIVLFSMFFFLIIALLLSLLGVQEVELGTPFISFLKKCSLEMNDFKIAIPDIPKIPLQEELNNFWVILNAFINFANALISIINILVSIINVVIEVIQFIVIMIKNLGEFVETLKATA